MVNLSDELQKWLKTGTFKKDVAELELYIYAVNLRLDAQSTVVQDRAKKALQAQGNKAELISQNLHKDRLIGPVFKLLYPDSSTPHPSL